MNGLHFGCGPVVVPGWANVDIDDYPGLSWRGDITNGMPFRDGAFDCAVGHHMLQMLNVGEIPFLLREVARCVRPGGLLRVSVPHLGLAVAEWQFGEGGFGLFPELHTRGARLNAYLTHYRQRTYFMPDLLADLLHQGRWTDARESYFGQSGVGFDADVLRLDTRPAESLFMEARRA